jgi:hypothetical protein
MGPTESSAEIINGELNLLANNRDIVKATLDLSDLHLEGLRYVCAEIYFVKYSFYTTETSFGNVYTYPNYFTLAIGEHTITEHYGGDYLPYSVDKINVLYEVESNGILTAVNEDKAIEDLVFHTVENNGNTKEIVFTAKTGWYDSVGEAPGALIIDKIEIYSINPS